MVQAKRTLLITLVSYLFFVGCVFGAESIDSNEVPSSVSITFLDTEAAKAVIMDKKLDSYFGQLQPMEMSAKTGSAITGATLEEQRAQCRKRYQEGVRAFTEDEKEAIRDCVEKLCPIVREKYPRFVDLPWSFLKVSNDIEGGLSHTQSKYVIFSEGTCGRFAKRYRSAPDRTISSFAGLLVHEQMHVFQRMNPEMFDSLYTDLWGFIKAEEISSCPWLDKYHLVNPDGPDCCWVFPIGQGKDTSYILPMVVFSEGEGLKRMPRDFRMIAVELLRDDGHFHPKPGEGGKPVHRNLRDVDEYRKLFSFTGNFYHPNEACASAFAILVMADFMSRDSNEPETIRKIGERIPKELREWFVKNLAATTVRSSQ